MNEIIKVNHLYKTYKILQKKVGIKNTWFNLFSKKYNYVNAINDVTFEAYQGEIFGILGRNGAGKSTLIKMMTGILQPSSGFININGYVPYENREKYVKNVGIVFGQRSQLWWTLPCIESFKILKELYAIDNYTYKKNLEYFNEVVQLDGLLNKPVRFMSLGERILCDILASFLHNPKVVFLDEPTIGLDIYIKESIRNLILNLNTEKKSTIVLTTHDMGDVDAICKRIIVLEKGEKIYDDSMYKLKNELGSKRILLFYVHMRDIADEIIAKSIMSLLKKSFGNHVKQTVKCENKLVKIAFNEKQISVTNLLNILQSKFKLEDIEIQKMSTEALIKEIYKEKDMLNEGYVL